ncbi:MAG TPA: hypothetical protein VIF37_02140 [Methylobacter sp.]
MKNLFTEYARIPEGGDSSSVKKSVGTANMPKADYSREKGRRQDFRQGQKTSMDTARIGEKDKLA